MAQDALQVAGTGGHRENQVHLGFHVGREKRQQCAQGLLVAGALARRVHEHEVAVGELLHGGAEIVGVQGHADRHVGGIGQPAVQPPVSHRIAPPQCLPRDRLQLDADVPLGKTLEPRENVAPRPRRHVPLDAAVVAVEPHGPLLLAQVDDANLAGLRGGRNGQEPGQAENEEDAFDLHKRNYLRNRGCGPR